MEVDPGSRGATDVNPNPDMWYSGTDATIGNTGHGELLVNRESMVSVNSIHVKFANNTVGYLFSQRGDAVMGYGGWWSVEVGGTRGTFMIENCVEKMIYQPSPGAEGAADPANLGLGEAPEPEVLDTGITDFGATFPTRIHAYLEDVTNGVPKHELRASGRDALATLEYTFAAIRSYENGGVMVQPDPLPILKRSPGID